jgi:glycosyltransferase involved in cell wall biosynthesis
MRIYHFHNGTGGGVLSVIKNLLRFSRNKSIEQHIIHAVNSSIVPEYIIEPIEGTYSQQLYYYTGSNNFFYTCRQLAKLLPDDKAIILAHDWVEMGMASNLGLQNPLIQILHGDFDYYYDLAQKHSHVVDAYICISPKIFKSLKSKLPVRNDDIFYLNFPVQTIEAKNKSNNILQLIYYVRDLKENRKQFLTIVEIARQLSDVASDYFFTIAGGGMTEQEFYGLWPAAMKGRVNYLGLQANESMIAMLPSQDIFLLPSLAEGLPVSLVEAMKAGVVPLVTNWDGAVDELITPDTTGYYLKPGAALDYAACIKKLQANRHLLNQLSHNCIERASALFDPLRNVKKFEDLYEKVIEKKTKRKDAVKVYGSRLDQKWLPNIITKTARNFK